MLDQLPIEMLENVASFMQERDVVRIGYCFKSWFFIVRERMLSNNEELERQIRMEPPNSRRKRLFLRHRRKLPRHVTIYYPRASIEFFKDLNLNLLDTTRENLFNEEEKLKVLIEKYLRNCDIMRLSFLQAQVKLYGMKYRDLENTCIYLKEFVSLLMEKRVNVEVRWHKFIMNRALIYILDSLAYYNGRTSIPLERKSRFFERFTEMMVEIWPYVKTSPYRIYLMNSHKTTLETIFCSQWKILPPLYEGYQVVAQFNELVLNATDMELKMLKYLAETIIPQSSPSHFNSFQEANHFFSITNSVHIKQNTTQQTEKKQEYIKKIITWIKDNPMLSAEERYCLLNCK